MAGLLQAVRPSAGAAYGKCKVSRGLEGGGGVERLRSGQVLKRKGKALLALKFYLNIYFPN